MFNIEKFNKEISKLKGLKKVQGSLTLEKQFEIKEKILKSIAEDSLLPTKQNYFFVRSFRYVAVLLLVVCLLGGTAYASQNSLPGEVLYPIKKAQEVMRLKVAVSEESQASLQAKFANKRLEELSKLTSKFNSEKPKQKLEVVTTVSTNTSPSVFPSPTSSTTTIATVVRSPRQAELEKQVKQEAKTEFKKALSSLRKVQQKQAAKGNVRAAEAIAINIQNLQESAKALSIQEEDEDEKKIELELETEAKVRGANTKKEGEDSNNQRKNNKIRIEINTER